MKIKNIYIYFFFLLYIYIYIFFFFWKNIKDNSNSNRYQSFQENKKYRKGITYYCKPITIEYEFQKENVNETVCFVLNKPVNIQKRESKSSKRKSILGSTSSIVRSNTSKRFSLYSLYRHDSKRTSISSNSSLTTSNILSGSLTNGRENENVNNILESEKHDDQYSSISSSYGGIKSLPSSLLEQEIGYEKMSEKDLNVYLVFRFYVQKEEK